MADKVPKLSNVPQTDVDSRNEADRCKEVGQLEEMQRLVGLHFDGSGPRAGKLFSNGRMTQCSEGLLMDKLN